MARFDGVRARRVSARKTEVVQCETRLARKKTRERPELIRVRLHALLLELSDGRDISVFVSVKLEHRRVGRRPLFELLRLRIRAEDILLRHTKKLGSYFRPFNCPDGAACV